jgi:hypothetical protein
MAHGMAASPVTAGGAGRDWLAQEANPGGARIDPSCRVRRFIVNLATERARVDLGALAGPGFSSLCDAVLMGDLDFEEASARALLLLHQRTTR